MRHGVIWIMIFLPILLKISLGVMTGIVAIERAIAQAVNRSSTSPSLSRNRTVLRRKELGCPMISRCSGKFHSFSRAIKRQNSQSS